MSTKAKTKAKLTKKNGYVSSKFLLCFRAPLVDNINMKKNVDVVSVPRRCTDGPSEPLFTFLAMAEKKAVVFPRIFPAAAAASLSANYDDENNYNIKDENGVQMKKMKEKKKKKGSRQRLLGLLKAVFFENAMAKRLRKGKLKQKNSRQSNGNENSLHSKELSSEVEDGKIPSNTSSSLQSSSLFTSSSVSSSSLSSNSSLSSDKNYKSFRLNNLERKQKQDNVNVHGKGSYGINTGLCFLLISLLILILWGKICAIFCTSAWLFVMPRSKITNNSPENIGMDSLRLDSNEYKKKIIMEGLIERNHSRGL